MTGGLRIGVLGPLTVSADGQPIVVSAGRLRTTLAVLALSAGRPVPPDQLADAVWGERLPSHPRRALTVYLTRLRKLLGSDAIRTEPWGYVLAITPGDVDALEFTGLLDGAAADADAEQDRLRRALALWRGEPFQDLPSTWQLQVEATRLAERRWTAVERRLGLDLATRPAAELIAELTELTTRHPVREGLWAHLMTALYRSGRQADALAAYQRLYRALADELGVQPGPEVQAVHRRILSGELAPEESVRPAAPTPRQLPAGAGSFTGRADALAQMTDIATDPGPDPIVLAIAGPAGVGKTALALHWAHRAADRFGDGQLYADLRGFDPANPPITPGDVLSGFLSALGVSAARIPADPQAQAALYRSRLAGRRMLVVLDNARDADQVRPLLPGTPGCAVVVTSRNELTGLIAYDGAQLLTLDVLAPDEAYRLLARRLGRARAEAEPEAVTEIIDRCGRLPLALGIVAARAAARPSFPVAALAAELAQSPRRLDALAGGDLVTDLRAVFACSYRTLSSAAARMFRLLGLHPGPDVSIAAAASVAAVTVAQARASLAEVARLHLLTEHTPGRYAFHDLLRAYAMELVEAEAATEREPATRRMFDHYLHSSLTAAYQVNPHRAHPPMMEADVAAGVTPESPGEAALAWLATERQVLKATLTAAVATGLDRHAVLLAWALGGFLPRSGRRGEQAETRLVALRAVERLGDRRELAWAHRGLARAHRELDRLDDAFEHLCQALALFIDLGDRAGEAHTQLSLGQIYEMRGDLEAARAQATRSLPVFREVGDTNGEALALNALGWCQAHLGDPQAGLASCEEALTLQQKTGDRYGESGTWDSLSVIHDLTGDTEQAIDCCRRALALHRESGDRYLEGQALIRLGNDQRTLGEVDGAARSFAEAVLILDDLDRPEADDARRALRDLPSQRAG
ncbi:DNA-binding SARP family transcriptional activator/tetratricopeptide (TPR) repeat protein [Hamadaea flava]|uniref:BTAD domain-containing putative transcriptional regulator n=1 Tax=Hamadaea flava TaxID=1742688 RepID=A0ABV8M0H7_9ACTN|nr:BTAD domain-containing putative transcriptional regulator [Hamadaea flava]MCP2328405.1 DNA-binding SARP family transcriptional activator/tetratricopeptide (TPR) repeat protein [Hamadaea flava]